MSGPVLTLLQMYGTRAAVRLFKTGPILPQPHLFSKTLHAPQVNDDSGVDVSERTGNVEVHRHRIGQIGKRLYLLQLRRRRKDQQSLAAEAQLMRLQKFDYRFQNVLAVYQSQFVLMPFGLWREHLVESDRWNSTQVIFCLLDQRAGVRLDILNAENQSSAMDRIVDLHHLALLRHLPDRGVKIAFIKIGVAGKPPFQLRHAEKQFLRLTRFSHTGIGIGAGFEIGDERRVGPIDDAAQGLLEVQPLVFKACLGADRLEIFKARSQNLFHALKINRRAFGLVEFGMQQQLAGRCAPAAQLRRQAFIPFGDVVKMVVPARGIHQEQGDPRVMQEQLVDQLVVFLATQIPEQQFALFPGRSPVLGDQRLRRKSPDFHANRGGLVLIPPGGEVVGECGFAHARFAEQDNLGRAELRAGEPPGFTDGQKAQEGSGAKCEFCGARCAQREAADTGPFVSRRPVSGKGLARHGVPNNRGAATVDGEQMLPARRPRHAGYIPLMA